jgi:hypothetical protein
MEKVLGIERPLVNHAHDSIHFGDFVWVKIRREPEADSIQSQSDSNGQRHYQQACTSTVCL